MRSLTLESLLQSWLEQFGVGRQFEIAQTLLKISTSLMRPPTQGQVIKKRVWCFIEALLTHAEESHGFEIRWETDKDTGNPVFVVNTKRRFLLSLTGLKTTELTEVIKSLESLKIWDDRRLKRGKGSPIGAFALKLWSRDAERNHEQFERVWEANRPEKSKALEKKSEPFDWQNICKTALEEQKRMTTNRLLDSEMVFDLNQIHVPLALVERKKQDKRQGDDFPDKSHSYKPEYEETQKFEYEEFLAVLKTTTNKKIAIIGEPGAGKTTLLQRIAFWVLENTDDLAIWISLGNLPTTGIDFKEYLLNNWLKNAIQSITSEIKADFDKQLTAGRVWLLLDGVDEMVTSGNALSFINNWLPAWSHNLHFVLTCRLNVWEANPNYLSGFQTYRTLEFNQDQVKQFINNCFQTRRGKPPVVAPKLGIELQQALNQPGKERIKDLVRNPLRLMLLCSTWQGLDGNLPDTKAELYQHFVYEVYRWKKDELRITPQQRKELNAKLKELALAAIDKEENRFSLRHKFVESVLGEWDDQVFQFALKVGWLNRVGVDGKNKPVYAFFHPTFQEYFAALEIKDWGYFLNHVPENPAQGIYRIFEPQWKEVFLLWLGREDVGKEGKEEFIKALVGFEDGCRDFYKFRAYFLAAMGTAELKSCTLADEIVAQIVKWGFGYFNVEKQEWRTFLKPIKEGARATILQTDCGRAIKGLLGLLATSQDESILLSAAGIVGKIDPGNQKVIDGLLQLVATSKDESIRWKATESLREIGTGNQQAIDGLLKLVTPSESESIRRRAAEIVGKIDPGNQQAINDLLELLATSKDESIRRGAANSLGEIGRGNQQAIDELLKLLATSKDKFISWIAANSLGKIDPGNQQAIDDLLKLLATSEDESIRRGATDSLGEIGRGTQQAIDGLLKLLTTSEDKLISWIAANSLGKIDPGNQQAINELLELLATNEDEDIRGSAADSLGEIGIGNQQAIDGLLKLLATSKDESILLSAAEILVKIGTENQQAIDELLKLVTHSEDEDILLSAADSLVKIDPGNQQAIDELLKLVATSEDKFIRRGAANSLGKIGIENQQAIDELLKLVTPSEDEFVRRFAANSLEEISTGNQQAIDELLKLWAASESENIRRIAAEILEKIVQKNQMSSVVSALQHSLANKYYKLIWHCAQTLPYPDFHQAWHSPHLQLPSAGA